MTDIELYTMGKSIFSSSEYETLTKISHIPLKCLLYFIIIKFEYMPYDPEIILFSTFWECIYIYICLCVLEPRKIYIIIMYIYAYYKVYSNIIHNKYNKCKLEAGMPSSSRMNKENVVYLQN